MIESIKNLFSSRNTSLVCMMGQSNSSNTTGGRNDTEPESKYEYMLDPFSPDRRRDGSSIAPTLICTDYQCMLIGAYGDQYPTNVKEDVVPKQPLPSKPGGKFLPGVSDDLEIVQELIRKDPRKQLVYVLSDIPGAQRSAASYLSKIERLFKECTSHGGESQYCYIVSSFASMRVSFKFIILSPLLI
jgi:hypothetical protein